MDKVSQLHIELTLKKRFVKRIVRKISLSLIIIAILVTMTVILKKRMSRNNRKPVEPFQILTLSTTQGERKDWTDYEAMEADKQRFGLGEHGLPAMIENPAEKKLEQELYRKNGFNGLLSDKISVNRSVPDVRREECKTRQYLAKLPSVSVIFIFYNEHFQTLLRSVYSIINRTPKELLKQIVLVDDGSDWESLKEQLDDYVSLHWPLLVDVVHNPERKGLIGARLAGAKVATGEVLVFFDSHIEVNYNWLPPLLEPIVVNKKISTCPIVDGIDHQTLAYRSYQEGLRGGFDWHLSYKQLPMFPDARLDNSLPFRTPVMIGGLFAINKEFFWDLGGYDDNLDIWGGEQYELSFKIWMCGGMILNIPCSRVAHIFHNPKFKRPSPRNYNYVARNYKRVAEVWMDEFKEYVYKRDPLTYDKIDAGDLSRQRAVREKLQCKSFDWYMKEVAPDFLVKFPPIEPPSYASGAIQSLGYPQYCIDSMNLSNENPVGLGFCSENLTSPHSNQFWSLSGGRELKRIGDIECLDVQSSHPNATIWMWECHNQGGNQFWYYDRQHEWIINGKDRIICLEAFVEGSTALVFVNECKKNNDRQRWTFGFLNYELLDHFFDNI